MISFIVQVTSFYYPKLWIEELELDLSFIRRTSSPCSPNQPNLSNKVHIEKAWRFISTQTPDSDKTKLVPSPNKFRRCFSFIQKAPTDGIGLLPTVARIGLPTQASCTPYHIWEPIRYFLSTKVGYSIKGYLHHCGFVVVCSASRNLEVDELREGQTPHGKEKQSHAQTRLSAGISKQSCFGGVLLRR